MKILPFLIFFFGCIQSYNSNSFDDEKYAPPSNLNQVDPKTEIRSKALSIIQINCISCHLGHHNRFSGFSTDAQWVSARLVIPGDSANSRLIRKLKNRGGNMPFNNPAISEEDVDALVDWIDQMENN